MIENDKKENKTDRKELEAQVLQMVAMSYKKDVKDLSISTSFKGDLGGASVQMVTLMSEIENGLDVELMLSETSACATVGDLTDLVEKELQGIELQRIFQIDSRKLVRRNQL